MFSLTDQESTSDASESRTCQDLERDLKEANEKQLLLESELAKEKQWSENLRQDAQKLQTRLTAGKFAFRIVYLFQLLQIK